MFKMRNIIILGVVLIALGMTYYLVTRPAPTKVDPKYYVWDFEMDNLEHITINLPQDNKIMSWIKHDDRQFYFDEANGVQVDAKRWGGGIPLLLSGPGADRLISQNTTDAKLAEFGFDQPSMAVQLITNDKKVWDIEVGDQSPNGQNYYVRLADSKDVYTVDTSWHDVLANLVNYPPYPGAPAPPTSATS